MTPEKVDCLLRDYRSNLARCKYLEGLIPVLEEEVSALRQKAADDSVQLRGPSWDGLPRDTNLSNPTQDIGILLASGYQPDLLKEKEGELKAVREEYRRKVPNVIFVEAWLKGLTPRENWIIQHHIIDAMTWNDVMTEYERTFGENRTKRCLQTLKRRALKKIYSYAI